MKDKLSDKLKSKKDIKKVVDRISKTIVKQLRIEGIRIKIGSRTFDKYLNLILDGSMSIEEAIIQIQEQYILREARYKRKEDKLNKYIP